jgi:hypothetical protein
MMALISTYRNALARDWPWITLVLCLFALGMIEHGAHLDKWLLAGSDQLGYYQFLPSALIDHDLREMKWTYATDQGQHISLFTIGVALLQLPFFLLGHLIAVFSGAETTGYSWPYALMQLLGTPVYTTAGLALIMSALRGTASRLAIIGSAIILLFGTNLIYYTVREPTMSHAYSFFLFAWVWNLTVRTRGPWWAARLFICSALIVLVRPLNGVALLLPLVLCRQALLDHVRTFGLGRAGLGLLCALAMILPQLLYWHAIMGKWLLFTYGVKGESFDWHSPHWFGVLFSHQNGWFIYSPLMLGAWLLLMRKVFRGDRASITLLAVWAILLYPYGSWWAWWLGGAFGFRGFIEISAWFAPALALGIDRVRSLSLPRRSCALLVSLFLVFLNLRLVGLYASPWDGPDWTWPRLLEILHRAIWLS